MNSKYKISIIVPVYNAEDYLKKCVDSLISQTYKNLEIILIDDGSTDNSLELCEKYKKIDNRVKVIHKENGGPSETRNLGIKNASGDYITFVDADDYISANMYKNLINSMKKFNSDISVCKIKKVNKYKKNNISNEYKIMKMLKEEALNDLLKLNSNITDYLYNKVYKKSLFNKIRLPEGMIFEDMSIMYKIINETKTGVTFCDFEGYYYVQHKKSLIHNVKQQDIIDGFKILKERYDYLIKNKNVNSEYLKQNRIDFILKMFVASAKHGYKDLLKNPIIKEEYNFFHNYLKNKKNLYKILSSYNILFKIYIILLYKHLNMFMKLVGILYQIKYKLKG